MATTSAITITTWASAVASDALLGPLALLVGSLFAVGVLWRSHVAADDDLRKQRDTAIDGWRAQTTATDRLANAIEIRNRRDATRRRAGDA